ncbi:MAG: hypothetical protein IPK19_18795 [Chloroflexi bacterium]|nr:hypothetical protein [Chloroflexota bacterium]
MKRAFTILACIGTLFAWVAWAVLRRIELLLATSPRPLRHLAAGFLLMVTPNASAAMAHFDAALALVPDDPALTLQAAAAFPDAEHQLRYLDRGIAHFPGRGNAASGARPCLVQHLSQRLAV